MSTRYVIEGEWTGYVASQSHVAHREVTTRKLRADQIKELGFIRFTDGTMLLLSVRPARFRERVEVKKQYSDLIAECVLYRINDVSRLDAARRKEEILNAIEHEADCFAEEQGK